MANPEELNYTSVTFCGSATLLALAATERVPGSNWDVTFAADGSTTITSLLRKGLTATIKTYGASTDGTLEDCATSVPGAFCKENALFRIQIEWGTWSCMRWNSTSREPVGENYATSTMFNTPGHLYGGSEQKRQYWPLDGVQFSDYSIVTKQEDNQGIAEPYWLSSDGYFIYISPEESLFLEQNAKYDHYITSTSRNKAPYPSPAFLVSKFAMCQFEDAKRAHMFAVQHLLGKPTGIPDERMITQPIWSTWARYKTEINENVVKEFAAEITQHGFDNSQLEIDDKWETCYGSLTFDTARFPNTKALTDALKAQGYRVTLWIHPFVNVDCEPFHQEGLDKGYFVRNTEGNTTSTWWNGVASAVDFTNPEAVEWWTGRLRALQQENGIDSFKFDAGETSWLPQVPVLTGDLLRQPNLYTEKYTHAVAQFGDMVEVRVAHGTQQLPVFVRMLDKDSRWDMENGLPTLVTTLLQMNLVGYPLVLPDMVGGNGYQGAPSKELFLRWLQANVFMPAIQFSYVPWDYDDEAIEISKTYVNLHVEYAPKIIELLHKAVQDGTPVNPPVWWVDPTDEVAQEINDEFLLGEDLLVAPVLEEGAVARDIYLPLGAWRDEATPANGVLQGPVWLRAYPAPLAVLPHFTRQR